MQFLREFLEIDEEALIQYVLLFLAILSMPVPYCNVRGRGGHVRSHYAGEIHRTEMEFGRIVAAVSVVTARGNRGL